MQIDKITVKVDGKSQDVIIAMTPEEGKDLSYREYLKEGATERTKSQLTKKLPRAKSKVSKVDRAEAIKDWRARQERRRNTTISRYFSGDYTS